MWWSENEDILSRIFGLRESVFKDLAVNMWWLEMYCFLDLLRPPIQLRSLWPSGWPSPYKNCQRQGLEDCCHRPSRSTNALWGPLVSRPSYRHLVSHREHTCLKVKFTFLLWFTTFQELKQIHISTQKKFARAAQRDDQQRSDLDVCSGWQAQLANLVEFLVSLRSPSPAKTFTQCQQPWLSA